MLAGSVLLLTISTATTAQADWISHACSVRAQSNGSQYHGCGRCGPRKISPSRRGFDFSFLTRRVKGKKSLSRIREPLDENDLMFAEQHVGMNMSSELRAVERPARLELRKYATIASGDNLVKILNKQGLARSDVNAINSAVERCPLTSPSSCPAGLCRLISRRFGRTPARRGG